MITDDERAARIAAARAEAEALRADPTVPRVAFWLSFCDAARPKGQQFLGGCLVDDVVNLADALTHSHRRGCNPGGEVASCEVPMDQIPDGYPRNVLLSYADLEALGPVDPMP